MTVPSQPAYGQAPVATDPFDAPIYGISFGGAFVRFFQKYARFSGRASLSEFWWMFLWNVIYSAAIGIIFWLAFIPVFADISALSSSAQTVEEQNAASGAIVGMIFARLIAFWLVIVVIGLALIVPHIALAVRRLHDTNRSGHFAWLYLIPSVGALIVLILCLMPTDPYGQRFDRPLAA